MSTSGDRTYSVWTYRDVSEETDSSDGASDLLLIDNQTEAEARTHAGRLAHWAPNASIEVRSAFGDTVTTYGPVRHGLSVADIPIPTNHVRRPRRRALGNRGA
jgi:hypothetical protein